LTSKFGLDSLCFSSRKNGDIFCFAMLLGAALQITNMFDTFIRDFGSNPEYQGTLGGTLCINYLLSQI
jgi:NHS family xanthosine MFS transporter